MRVFQTILGGMLAVLVTCPLVAQTPVLGDVETPYADLQSTVHMAGAVYGPGAVAYGPVGTPLVVSGSDLGASGTVQFIPYANGVAGTPVQATATLWESTMVFVSVPSGATSGLVEVTVGGKQSNGLPFLVTPGTYAGSCPTSPPANQLQITTTGLSNGTVGQAYSATLQASGGTTAYTWSIVSGTLPAGLSLSASTGTISGTPTSATASPVNLTVQVADSSNPQQTDQTVLSLGIQSETLTPATIYTYTANYDNVGNVIGYSDTTANSGTIMGTWTFQYDSLNRLVSGSSTAGSYSGKDVCWTYDAFGNRTSESSPSTTACADSPPLQSWATYNTSNTNRMDTDSASNAYGRTPGYDAAGDLTSDGGNTYLYDAEGRVCAVESTPVSGYTTMTGYLYDAEGRRVAKGTITSMSCDPATNGFQRTESYVLGQGGEELTMLDGSGKWQRTNVYGTGKLLAAYDTNGLHFQITDPLGTRRMQVSGNSSSLGQPETDIQSLPYGDLLNSYPDQYAPPTGDDATPLYFTGKERDSESGNDYFGARYYASTMGRWLSPDWAEKPTAVPYAIFTNPQSLNLYQYEGNNPLAKADKDGHCWPVCTVLAGAAVGALTGGAIEAGAEYFTTGKVNWNKVGNAAVAGLVTGAIVGAAGPEAGLAAKAVIGAVGGVAGGAFERTVNGEKAGDVKAIAIDAAAGAVSPKIEAVADRTFATEAISKTVSKATDATVDAGRRMSDSSEQPKPQQSQPQQQQPQQQHKTCSSGTSGCN